MSRMERHPKTISLGEESSNMWSLNKRLEAYLSRVKTLEEENKLLRAEIHHLRSTKSDKSLMRKYHDEILKLRAALDDEHREMARVEIDRDSIYHEIQYVKELCFHEKQAQEDAKNELSEGKKFLEEEKRIQIWLKERLIQLEEEIEDILKAHEEDKAVMEEQISSYSQRLENFRIVPVNFKPVNVEDYANKLSQLWQGAVEDYKNEVSALEANLFQARENLKKVLDENKQSELHLQNLDGELHSLKDKKEMLEVFLAKEELEQEEEEGRLQLEIETLEKEKQDLRAQIAQVLEDRQQLMHLKMSLSLEVATYRSLLEAECTRLYTPSVDYKISSSFNDSMLEQNTFRKGWHENTKPLVSRDNRFNANKKKSADTSRTNRSLNVKSTSFLNKASPPTKEFQKVSTVLQSQGLNYTKASSAKAATTLPPIESNLRQHLQNGDVFKKSKMETISQHSSKLVSKKTVGKDTDIQPVFNGNEYNLIDAGLKKTDHIGGAKGEFPPPTEKETISALVKSSLKTEGKHIQVISDVVLEGKQTFLDAQNKDNDTLVFEKPHQKKVDFKVPLASDEGPGEGFRNIDEEHTIEKQEVSRQIVSCQRVDVKKEELVEPQEYPNIETSIKVNYEECRKDLDLSKSNTQDLNEKIVLSSDGVSDQGIEYFLRQELDFGTQISPNNADVDNASRDKVYINQGVDEEKQKLQLKGVELSPTEETFNYVDVEVELQKEEVTKAHEFQVLSSPKEDSNQLFDDEQNFTKDIHDEHKSEVEDHNENPEKDAEEVPHDKNIQNYNEFEQQSKGEAILEVHHCIDNKQEYTGFDQERQEEFELCDASESRGHLSNEEDFKTESKKEEKEIFEEGFDLEKNIITAEQNIHDSTVIEQSTIVVVKEVYQSNTQMLDDLEEIQFQSQEEKSLFKLSDLQQSSQNYIKNKQVVQTMDTEEGKTLPEIHLDSKQEESQVIAPEKIVTSNEQGEDIKKFETEIEKSDVEPQSLQSTPKNNIQLIKGEELKIDVQSLKNYLTEEEGVIKTSTVEFKNSEINVDEERKEDVSEENYKVCTIVEYTKSIKTKVIVQSILEECQSYEENNVTENEGPTPAGEEEDSCIPEYETKKEQEQDKEHYQVVSIKDEDNEVKQRVQKESNVELNIAKEDGALFKQDTEPIVEGQSAASTDTEQDKTKLDNIHQGSEVDKDQPSYRETSFQHGSEQLVQSDGGKDHEGSSKVTLTTEEYAVSKEGGTEQAAEKDHGFVEEAQARTTQESQLLENETHVKLDKVVGNELEENSSFYKEVEEGQESYHQEVEVAQEVDHEEVEEGKEGFHQKVEEQVSYEAISMIKENLTSEENNERDQSIQKVTDEEQYVGFSLNIISSNLRFTSKDDTEAQPEEEEQGSKLSDERKETQEYEIVCKEEFQNLEHNNDDISMEEKEKEQDIFETEIICQQSTFPLEHNEYHLLESSKSYMAFAENVTENYHIDRSTEKHLTELYEIKVADNLDNEYSKTEDSLESQDISICSQKSEEFEISKDYHLEQTLPDTTPLPNLDDEFEELAEDEIILTSEQLAEVTKLQSPADGGEAEEVLDSSVESQSSQMLPEVSEKSDIIKNDDRDSDYNEQQAESPKNLLQSIVPNHDDEFQDLAENEIILASEHLEEFTRSQCPAEDGESEEVLDSSLESQSSQILTEVSEQFNLIKDDGKHSEYNEQQTESPKDLLESEHQEHFVDLKAEDTSATQDAEKSAAEPDTQTEDQVESKVDYESTEYKESTTFQEEVAIFSPTVEEFYPSQDSKLEIKQFETSLPDLTPKSVDFSEDQVQLSSEQQASECADKNYNEKPEEERSTHTENLLTKPTEYDASSEHIETELVPAPSQEDTTDNQEEIIKGHSDLVTQDFQLEQTESVDTKDHERNYYKEGTTPLPKSDDEFQDLAEEEIILASKQSTEVTRSQSLPDGDEAEEILDNSLESQSSQILPEVSKQLNLMKDDDKLLEYNEQQAECLKDLLENEEPEHFVDLKAEDTSATLDAEESVTEPNTQIVDQVDSKLDDEKSEESTTSQEKSEKTEFQISLSDLTPKAEILSEDQVQLSWEQQITDSVEEDCNEKPVEERSTHTDNLLTKPTESVSPCEQTENKLDPSSRPEDTTENEEHTRKEHSDLVTQDLGLEQTESGDNERDFCKEDTTLVPNRDEYQDLAKEEIKLHHKHLAEVTRSQCPTDDGESEEVLYSSLESQSSQIRPELSEQLNLIKDDEEHSEYNEQQAESPKDLLESEHQELFVDFKAEDTSALLDTEERAAEPNAQTEDQLDSKVDDEKCKESTTFLDEVAIFSPKVDECEANEDSQLEKTQIETSSSGDQVHLFSEQLVSKSVDKDHNEQPEPSTTNAEDLLLKPTEFDFLSEHIVTELVPAPSHEDTTENEEHIMREHSDLVTQDFGLEQTESMDTKDHERDFYKEDSTPLPKHDDEFQYLAEEEIIASEQSTKVTKSKSPADGGEAEEVLDSSLESQSLQLLPDITEQSNLIKGDDNDSDYNEQQVESPKNLLESENPEHFVDLKTEDSSATLNSEETAAEPNAQLEDQVESKLDDEKSETTQFQTSLLDLTTKAEIVSEDHVVLSSEQQTSESLDEDYNETLEKERSTHTENLLTKPTECVPSSEQTETELVPSSNREDTKENEEHVRKEHSALVTQDFGLGQTESGDNEHNERDICMEDRAPLPKRDDEYQDLAEEEIILPLKHLAEVTRSQCHADDGESEEVIDSSLESQSSQSLPEVSEQLNLIKDDDKHSEYNEQPAESPKDLLESEHQEHIVDLKAEDPSAALDTKEPSAEPNTQTEDQVKSKVDNKKSEESTISLDEVAIFSPKVDECEASEDQVQLFSEQLVTENVDEEHKEDTEARNTNAEDLLIKPTEFDSSSEHIETELAPAPSHEDRENEEHIMKEHSDLVTQDFWLGQTENMDTEDNKVEICEGTTSLPNHDTTENTDYIIKQHSDLVTQDLGLEQTESVDTEDNAREVCKEDTTLLLNRDEECQDLAENEIILASEQSRVVTKSQSPGESDEAKEFLDSTLESQSSQIIPEITEHSNLIKDDDKDSDHNEQVESPKDLELEQLETVDTEHKERDVYKETSLFNLNDKFQDLAVEKIILASEQSTEVTRSQSPADGGEAVKVLDSIKDDDKDSDNIEQQVESSKDLLESEIPEHYVDLKTEDSSVTLDSEEPAAKPNTQTEDRIDSKLTDGKRKSEESKTSEEEVCLPKVDECDANTDSWLEKTETSPSEDQTQFSLEYMVSESMDKHHDEAEERRPSPGEENNADNLLTKTLDFVPLSEHSKTELVTSLKHENTTENEEYITREHSDLITQDFMLEQAESVATKDLVSDVCKEEQKKCVVDVIHRGTIEPSTESLDEFNEDNSISSNVSDIFNAESEVKDGITLKTYQEDVKVYIKPSEESSDNDDLVTSDDISPNVSTVPEPSLIEKIEAQTLLDEEKDILRETSYSSIDSNKEHQDMPEFNREYSEDGKIVNEVYGQTIIQATLELDQHMFNGHSTRENHEINISKAIRLDDDRVNSQSKEIIEDSEDPINIKVDDKKSEESTTSQVEVAIFSRKVFECDASKDSQLEKTQFETAFPDFTPKAEDLTKDEVQLSSEQQTSENVDEDSNEGPEEERSAHTENLLFNPAEYAPSSEHSETEIIPDPNLEATTENEEHIIKEHSNLDTQDLGVEQTESVDIEDNERDICKEDTTPFPNHDDESQDLTEEEITLASEQSTEVTRSQSPADDGEAVEVLDSSLESQSSQILPEVSEESNLIKDDETDIKYNGQQVESSEDLVESVNPEHFVDLKTEDFSATLDAEESAAEENTQTEGQVESKVDDEQPKSEESSFSLEEVAIFSPKVDECDLSNDSKAERTELETSLPDLTLKSENLMEDQVQLSSEQQRSILTENLLTKPTECVPLSEHTEAQLVPAPNLEDTTENEHIIKEHSDLVTQDLGVEQTESVDNNYNERGICKGDTTVLPKCDDECQDLAENEIILASEQSTEITRSQSPADGGEATEVLDSSLESQSSQILPEVSEESNLIKDDEKYIKYNEQQVEKHGDLVNIGNPEHFLELKMEDISAVLDNEESAHEPNTQSKDPVDSRINDENYEESTTSQCEVAIVSPKLNELDTSKDSQLEKTQFETYSSEDQIQLSSEQLVIESVIEDHNEETEEIRLTQGEDKNTENVFTITLDLFSSLEQSETELVPSLKHEDTTENEDCVKKQHSDLFTQDFGLDQEEKVNTEDQERDFYKDNNECNVDLIHHGKIEPLTESLEKFKEDNIISSNVPDILNEECEVEDRITLETNKEDIKVNVKPSEESSENDDSVTSDDISPNVSTISCVPELEDSKMQCSETSDIGGDTDFKSSMELEENKPLLTSEPAPEVNLMEKIENQIPPDEEKNIVGETSYSSFDSNKKHEDMPEVIREHSEDGKIVNEVYGQAIIQATLDLDQHMFKGHSTRENREINISKTMRLDADRVNSKSKEVIEDSEDQIYIKVDDEKSVESTTLKEDVAIFSPKVVECDASKDPQLEKTQFETPFPDLTTKAEYLTKCDVQLFSEQQTSESVDEDSNEGPEEGRSAHTENLLFNPTEYAPSSKHSEIEIIPHPNLEGTTENKVHIINEHSDLVTQDLGVEQIGSIDIEDKENDICKEDSTPLPNRDDEFQELAEEAIILASEEPREFTKSQSPAGGVEAEEVLDSSLESQSSQILPEVSKKSNLINDDDKATGYNEQKVDSSKDLLESEHPENFADLKSEDSSPTLDTEESAAEQNVQTEDPLNSKIDNEISEESTTSQDEVEIFSSKVDECDANNDSQLEKTQFETSPSKDQVQFSSEQLVRKRVDEDHNEELEARTTNAEDFLIKPTEYDPSSECIERELVPPPSHEDTTENEEHIMKEHSDIVAQDFGLKQTEKVDTEDHKRHFHTEDTTALPNRDDEFQDLEKDEVIASEQSTEFTRSQIPADGGKAVEVLDSSLESQSSQILPEVSEEPNLIKDDKTDIKYNEQQVESCEDLVESEKPEHFVGLKKEDSSATLDTEESAAEPNNQTEGGEAEELLNSNLESQLSQMLLAVSEQLNLIKDDDKDSDYNEQQVESPIDLLESDNAEHFVGHKTGDSSAILDTEESAAEQNAQTDDPADYKMDDEISEESTTAQDELTMFSSKVDECEASENSQLEKTQIETPPSEDEIRLSSEQVVRESADEDHKEEPIEIVSILENNETELVTSLSCEDTTENDEYITTEHSHIVTQVFEFKHTESVDTKDHEINLCEKDTILLPSRDDEFQDFVEDEIILALEQSTEVTKSQSPEDGSLDSQKSQSLLDISQQSNVIKDDEKDIKYNEQQAESPEGLVESENPEQFVDFKKEDSSVTPDAEESAAEPNTQTADPVDSKIDDEHSEESTASQNEVAIVSPKVDQLDTSKNSQLEKTQFETFPSEDQVQLSSEYLVSESVHEDHNEEPEEIRLIQSEVKNTENVVTITLDLFSSSEQSKIELFPSLKDKDTKQNEDCVTKEHSDLVTQDFGLEQTENIDTEDHKTDIHKEDTTLLPNRDDEFQDLVEEEIILASEQSTEVTKSQSPANGGEAEEVLDSSLDSQSPQSLLEIFKKLHFITDDEKDIKYNEQQVESPEGLVERENPEQFVDLKREDSSVTPDAAESAAEPNTQTADPVDSKMDDEHSKESTASQDEVAIVLPKVDELDASKDSQLEKTQFETFPSEDQVQLSSEYLVSESVHEDHNEEPEEIRLIQSEDKNTENVVTITLDLFSSSEQSEIELFPFLKDEDKIQNEDCVTKEHSDLVTQDFGLEQTENVDTEDHERDFHKEDTTPLPNRDDEFQDLVEEEIILASEHSTVVTKSQSPANGGEAEEVLDSSLDSQNSQSLLDISQQLHFITDDEKDNKYNEQQVESPEGLVECENPEQFVDLKTEDSSVTQDAEESAAEPNTQTADPVDSKIDDEHSEESTASQDEVAIVLHKVDELDASKDSQLEKTQFETFSSDDQVQLSSEYLVSESVHEDHNEEPEEIRLIQSEDNNTENVVTITLDLFSSSEQSEIELFPSLKDEDTKQNEDCVTKEHSDLVTQDFGLEQTENVDTEDHKTDFHKEDTTPLPNCDDEFKDLVEDEIILASEQSTEVTKSQSPEDGGEVEEVLDSSLESQLSQILPEVSEKSNLIKDDDKGTDYNQQRCESPTDLLESENPEHFVQLKTENSSAILGTEESAAEQNARIEDPADSKMDDETSEASTTSQDEVAIFSSKVDDREAIEDSQLEKTQIETSPSENKVQLSSEQLLSKSADEEHNEEPEASTTNSENILIKSTEIVSLSEPIETKVVPAPSHEDTTENKEPIIKEHCDVVAQDFGLEQIEYQVESKRDDEKSGESTTSQEKSEKTLFDTSLPDLMPKAENLSEDQVVLSSEQQIHTENLITKPTECILSSEHTKKELVPAPNHEDTSENEEYITKMHSPIITQDFEMEQTESVDTKDHEISLCKEDTTRLPNHDNEFQDLVKDEIILASEQSIKVTKSQSPADGGEAQEVLDSSLDSQKSQNILNTTQQSNLIKDDEKDIKYNEQQAESPKGLLESENPEQFVDFKEEDSSATPDAEESAAEPNTQTADQVDSKMGDKNSEESILCQDEVAIVSPKVEELDTSKDSQLQKTPFETYPSKDQVQLSSEYLVNESVHKDHNKEPEEIRLIQSEDKNTENVVTITLDLFSSSERSEIELFPSLKDEDKKQNEDCVTKEHFDLVTQDFRLEQVESVDTEDHETDFSKEDNKECVVDLIHCGTTEPSTESVDDFNEDNIISSNVPDILNADSEVEDEIILETNDKDVKVDVKPSEESSENDDSVTSDEISPNVSTISYVPELKDSKTQCSEKSDIGGDTDFKSPKELEQNNPLWTPEPILEASVMEKIESQTSPYEEKDIVGETSYSSFDSNKEQEDIPEFMREYSEARKIVNGVYGHTIIQATLDFDEHMFNGHSTGENHTVIISKAMRLDDDRVHLQSQENIEDSVIGFTMLDASEHKEGFLDEPPEITNIMQTAVKYMDSAAHQSHHTNKTVNPYACEKDLDEPFQITSSVMDEDLVSTHQEVNETKIKQEQHDLWSSDE